MTARILFLSLVIGTTFSSAYGQRLEPDRWINHEKFGQSVSVSGETALIGLGYEAFPGSPPGVVYCYEHDGVRWIETQTLTAPDGANVDNFSVVDHDGKVAVVGARLHHESGISCGRDNPATTNCGAAYFYRFDDGQWQLEQKVTVDGSIRLGDSVSISGDVAIIGDSRAAHIFRHDGSRWSLEQSLTNQSGTGRSLFGRWVSIRNDVAMVSDERMHHPTLGADTGQVLVYRYEGGQWVETQRLEAHDSREDHHFGRGGIAQDDGVAIIGQVSDFYGFGAAYVFREVGG